MTGGSTTTTGEPESPAAASPSALALSAGTGTLLLWSGTPIANKVAVGYMDGLTAGLLRSTLAGAVALIVACAMRLPFPEPLRDRAMLALAGIASFAAWPVTLSIGMQYTTAGHAALILATIPVIAVLIAAALDRHPPKAGWWLGAAVALTGCAVLVAARGELFAASQRGTTLGGDLIVFTGGVICAVGYVAGGRLSPRIGTAATTFWGLSIAMIVLVPFFLAVQQNTAWSQVEVSGWLAMGWMSLLSSLAAYVLWFYALGRGGIRRISSLLLVMPAVTLLGAAVLLGEPLTWLLLVSCAAVIAGTYFAQRHAG
ncbi:MAG: DMT family transporter [Gammaproteobacteria bacterium]|nr:DMT family transporter [Gammaproteobacteria bacterium]